jgi:hypothetical protein
MPGAAPPPAPSASASAAAASGGGGGALRNPALAGNPQYQKNMEELESLFNRVGSPGDATMRRGTGAPLPTSAAAAAVAQAGNSLSSSPPQQQPAGESGRPPIPTRNVKQPSIHASVLSPHPPLP